MCVRGRSLKQCRIRRGGHTKARLRLTVKDRDAEGTVDSQPPQNQVEQAGEVTALVTTTRFQNMEQACSGLLRRTELDLAVEPVLTHIPSMSLLSFTAG